MIAASGSIPNSHIGSYKTTSIIHVHQGLDAFEYYTNIYKRHSVHMYSTHIAIAIVIAVREQLAAQNKAIFSVL